MQLPFDLFPHLLKKSQTFFSYFPTPSKKAPIPRARKLPFFLHSRRAEKSHRLCFNNGERLRGGSLVETKTRNGQKQVLIFLAVKEVGEKERGATERATRRRWWEYKMGDKRSGVATITRQRQRTKCKNRGALMVRLF